MRRPGDPLGLTVDDKSDSRTSGLLTLVPNQVH